MADKTLKRSFGATIDIKAARSSNDYTIPAMVSTASVDSYGEIILPSAFVRDLGRYQSNPVLCWGHPLSAMCETPQPKALLGRADTIDVRVERNESDLGGLDCLFRYAVKENPDALMCYNLVKGGYLKAYSIGAYCLEWVTLEDKDSDTFNALPEFARLALLLGKANCIHTRMQLIEISQVLVGACPEALAAEQAVMRAVRDGVVPREFAARMLGTTERTSILVPRSLSEKAEAAIEGREVGEELVEMSASTEKVGRLTKMCNRVTDVENAVHAKLDALMVCLEVVGAEVRALQTAIVPPAQEPAPAEPLATEHVTEQTTSTESISAKSSLMKRLGLSRRT